MAFNNNFSSYSNFSTFAKEWREAKPFSHITLPNFLNKDVANAVASEFPDLESSDWRIYNNALEIKKTLNHWDKFGPNTYQVFEYLNSSSFVSGIESLVECELFPDFGLNGGGLHSHKRGSKSNVHLDYSIHPKLKLERRINLLIYMTPNWKEAYGGALELHAKHPDRDAPGELVKMIFPMFNTALLFDTSQESWHGLPEPIMCPEKITRNSLAVYYLSEPRENTTQRGKALFYPHKDQIDDPEVIELIRKRSSVIEAAKVYGD